MRNGLQFGINYTYSISFKGNAGMTGGGLGPGLRLDHAADGSFTVRADQAEYEKLNEDMGGTAAPAQSERGLGAASALR